MQLLGTMFIRNTSFNYSVQVLALLASYDVTRPRKDSIFTVVFPWLEAVFVDENKKSPIKIENLSVDKVKLEKIRKDSHSVPFRQLHSEDFISRTKLGRYATKEYSSSYEAMKDSHRSIEYTWGTIGTNGYFNVTVRSGKVSKIFYYQDGHYYSERG